MSPRCRLFSVLAAILILAAVKVQLDFRLEPVHQRPDVARVVNELSVQYPEKAFLGGVLASLGFDEVLTDYFFLESVQIFGDWRASWPSRYQRALPLAWAMSTLSPHFIEGYTLGSLIMEESGHRDEAIRFLDEGIRHNPDAFDLFIYRDFMLRLFRTKDYEGAIRGISYALSQPGHPPLLERMLAFALEKNGQLKDSILQWAYVWYHAPNARIEGIARGNLRRVADLLRQRDGYTATQEWLEVHELVQLVAEPAEQEDTAE